MLECCNGVTLCKLYRHGLYVCIILEIVQYRTTFRIFCNFTQKITPEENSCKMFHISSLIVFFSYGKVKDAFYKDQISSGGQKEGVRGVWGRNPK